jgi:hypothetical protein
MPEAPIAIEIATVPARTAKTMRWMSGRLV